MSKYKAPEAGTVVHWTDLVIEVNGYTLFNGGDWDSWIGNRVVIGFYKEIPVTLKTPPEPNGDSVVVVKRNGKEVDRLRYNAKTYSWAEAPGRWWSDKRDTHASWGWWVDGKEGDCFNSDPPFEGCEFFVEESTLTKIEEQ